MQGRNICETLAILHKKNHSEPRLAKIVIQWLRWWSWREKMEFQKHSRDLGLCVNQIFFLCFCDETFFLLKTMLRGHHRHCRKENNLKWDNISSQPLIFWWEVTSKFNEKSIWSRNSLLNVLDFYFSSYMSTCVFFYWGQKHNIKDIRANMCNADKARWAWEFLYFQICWSFYYCVLFKSHRCHCFPLRSVYSLLTPCRDAGHSLERAPHGQ